ncbi:Cloroperoxidase [Mycena kentingensis (nom. inval.)]|nr:Cloroperoxidase [Mycena kentingensis (nom. inval.)]
MHSLSFFVFAAIALAVRVAALDVQDGQTGVVMGLPPLPTDTSLKRIPDAAHPFVAPRPDDQRGPCPAMNTLANHGYIPRDGIASFEELITGMMEVGPHIHLVPTSDFLQAFNLPITIASGLAANNFLTRGNVFINKISIGGISSAIPPYPGKLDGPVTAGIAKHGRVEGDASITRADEFIGDNRNFQDILYDLALLQLGKFGSDGPDNSTVFNVKTLSAISRQAIARDQAANPQFTLNQARLNGLSAANSLILDAWANGTTKLSTLQIVGSFFRNQTFPDNWFRSAGTLNATAVGIVAAQINSAIATPAGRNNAQGVFVLDPPPPAPWNSSFACATYWDQLGHIPSSLGANTTGVLRQNVDFLLDIMFKAPSANPGCTESIAPFGAVGI